MLIWCDNQPIQAGVSAGQYGEDVMETVKLTGSKYDDTKITMHYATQNADVNQGDLLYPRIFNIIVDVIVWNWDRLVKENEVGLKGFYHSMTQKSAFFYEEYGLVTYTNSVWI